MLLKYFQEFFDRKRFGELKSTSSKSNVKKKLSQDLLALYTVSRVHSKTKQGKFYNKLCLATLENI